MRLLLTFISLATLSIVSFAGGFHFPDEDYEYAKIYYYNIAEQDIKPDYLIYSDEQGWAPSLIDPNIISSTALTQNIEKLFLYGADGLINGLSGCFIPRHGVVYFDKNDKPVASISICFECGGIRMWTKTKGTIKAKGEGSTTRAGQQISTLKKFILKEKVIVSENKTDYYSLLTNEGASITMEVYQLDQEIVNASYRDVMLWNTNNSFKEDVNVEYSAGGEKYEFAELYMDDDTKLSFDGPETSSKMVEAKIYNENVVLPNGIHVGSSLDDVMNTFPVYDGPANPETIVIKDHDNSIKYHFSEGKVDFIEVLCYVH